MPHYTIAITSSDGALASAGPEGITLDGIGAARALVVETLVEAARERPAPGMTRTITVTARDERGDVAYTDSTTVRGGRLPGSDDAAVGRAIQAMGRRWAADNIEGRTVLRPFVREAAGTKKAIISLTHTN